MCQHAVTSCEDRRQHKVRYVKCHVVGCDGSAKLIGEHFFIGVCLHLYNARRAICLLHAPIAYCVKTKQARGVVENIDVAVFFPLLHCPPLLLRADLSTPAFSARASSCHVVHSRDVRPCFFVSTCPLPCFPPLHI